MKHHRVSLALALLIAFEGAQAQSNAAVVCGKVLNEPGALSLASYVQAAKDPTRRVDHDALASMVSARATAWPAAVSEPVLGALVAFKHADASLSPGKMRIFKTMSELESRQIGLPGTRYEIELPPSAGAPLCSDPVEAAARIDAAYVILLMERAHATVLAKGMKLTSDQISLLGAKYDRYLYEGFPMFPWEAWANSKFLTKDAIADGPPRDSLVLLHPSAGVVGSVESAARSDTDGTFAVEAVGWIRYAEGHKKWYGASLLAVFPTDRDPGYGLAFNYGIYKVGATWHHDRESDHHGWAVFLGMDFLQFVNEKYRTYDSYKQKVAGVLDDLGT